MKTTVLACVLFVAAATLLPAAPESAKPNVLFIIVDDLTTTQGCYGKVGTFKVAPTWTVTATTPSWRA